MDQLWIVVFWFYLGFINGMFCASLGRFRFVGVGFFHLGNLLRYRLHTYWNDQHRCLPSIPNYPYYYPAPSCPVYSNLTVYPTPVRQVVAPNQVIFQHLVSVFTRDLWLIFACGRGCWLSCGPQRYGTGGRGFLKDYLAPLSWPVPYISSLTHP
jgi:hypothetical protein